MRVRFIGFGEHSLNIEVHCYIETTDINVFKAVTEDLYLRMMDNITSAGTSIALPAAIEYQGELAHLESTVSINDDISVELSEQEIEEIKNSISYPTKMD